jgi:glycosyltransferase involved in cell wall biosynthesis
MNSKSRPHILILQPEAELYGACRSMLRSIQALGEDAPRITSCFPAAGPAVEAYAAAGCETIIEPRLLVVRRSVSSIRAFPKLFTDALVSTWRLRRWSKRNGVDIVHSNSCFMLSGALLHIFAGRRHVWHFREYPTGAKAFRVALRFIARIGADAVIAVSTASATLAHEAVVVANGYDAPPSRTETAHRDHERLRIAVIGRISVRKGQWIAIQAFEKMAPALRDRCELLIVGTVFHGNVEDARELSELVDTLPADIQTKVHFLGRQEDMQTVFDAIDVLCVATATGEGFCNVVLEAMAHGVPVVAASEGGVTDLIEDEVSGLLLPPNDPDSLARAFEQLVSDNSLRDRFITNGYSVAQTHTTRHAADGLSRAWRAVSFG